MLSCPSTTVPTDGIVVAGRVVTVVSFANILVENQAG